MYVDALGLVSDAQAFGAGAVSANSIDLGTASPQREIGDGEPIGFGVAVDVAATGTNVLIEAISATDGPLTASVRVHGSIDGPVASFPAGSLHFVPIGRGGDEIQRFIGIRTTQAAGTLTATAWLTSWKLFSRLARAYQKGYTIN